MFVMATQVGRLLLGRSGSAAIYTVDDDDDFVGNNKKTSKAVQDETAGEGALTT